MSLEEGKELKAQLDQYSADGYIEPAQLPTRMVRHLPGKGRRLAPLYWLYGLESDKYHLPRIEELLDGLLGYKVFSRMDIQQGFHQIRGFPEHVDPTAFQTNFGSYQFKVMPLGQCNAPATFQRTLDINFYRCCSFVSLYLDGLIIHFKTTQEHLLHLRQVFSILRAERFYAKPSKCQFFLPNLILSALLSAPRPLSPREVSSRLSVSGLLQLPPRTSVPFWEFVVLPTLCSKFQHVGGHPNGPFGKCGGMNM